VASTALLENAIADILFPIKLSYSAEWACSFPVHLTSWFKCYQRASWPNPAAQAAARE